MNDGLSEGYAGPDIFGSEEAIRLRLGSRLEFRHLDFDGSFNLRDIAVNLGQLLFCESLSFCILLVRINIWAK